MAKRGEDGEANMWFDSLCGSWLGHGLLGTLHVVALLLAAECGKTKESDCFLLLLPPGSDCCSVGEAL